MIRCIYHMIETVVTFVLISSHPHPTLAKFSLSIWSFLLPFVAVPWSKEIVQDGLTVSFVLLLFPAIKWAEGGGETITLKYKPQVLFIYSCWCHSSLLWHIMGKNRKSRRIAHMTPFPHSDSLQAKYIERFTRTVICVAHLKSRASHKSVKLF